ncbi:hypothetical protein OKA06_18970 [Novosphingobium sp. MW5]|nr:hypothetical protein [Novosphingobium sp. MW5]
MKKAGARNIRREEAGFAKKKSGHQEESPVAAPVISPRQMDRMVKKAM